MLKCRENYYWKQRIIHKENLSLRIINRETHRGEFQTFFFLSLFFDARMLNRALPFEQLVQVLIGVHRKDKARCFSSSIIKFHLSPRSLNNNDNNNKKKRRRKSKINRNDRCQLLSIRQRSRLMDGV